MGSRLTYKLFWDDISEMLLASYNYSFNQNKLCISQRRGIITLIPKQGKDHLYLNNWRPITLLNVDYKILAKTIAIRLKSKLTDIIHPDQTGFLKDRYIGENIRTIFDIINQAEEKNLPNLVFFIEFEKAFDKVEWPFIEYVLNLFGFGKTIIKWIKLLL